MAHCSAPKTTKTKNIVIPKSVLRNVEVRPNCGGVYSHSMGQCCCWQHHNSQPYVQQHSCVETKKEKKDKYSTPQLNTVMRQVEQIQTLEEQLPPRYKSTSDLTPRSKAAIAPKISQKLNFNACETVFKKLTPINVNDSVLLPKKTTSLRKKYTKCPNKIPVPELCDFLNPLPPLTYVIPEPEITLEFSEHHFDAFGHYLRLFD